MNPIAAVFRWISQFWRSRKRKSLLILQDVYKDVPKTARIVRVIGVEIPGVVVIFRLTPPHPNVDQLAIHLVDMGMLRQQSAIRATRTDDGLPGTRRLPYEQEHRQWCQLHGVDPSHTTHAICVFWLLPSYDAKRQITKQIEVIPGNLQHPYHLGNRAAIAITQQLALKIALLPDVPNANRPWKFYIERFDWTTAIERVAEQWLGSLHVFQRRMRR